MPTQFVSTIELSDLNGFNGFKLNGVAAGGRSGHSVASVGDINGDGAEDMIIGAYGASPNGSYSGQSYVIFGGSGVGNSGTVQLSSLNGSNGFRMNGIAASDFSGCSVASAGDINADGVGDMIVGAYKADPNGSQFGQSYVIFGGSGVGSSGTLQLSNLNGSNGFKINGIAAGDSSGISVASAGDINDDGISDLIVGADGADPNGFQSGQSYIIFGGLGVGSLGTLQLSNLNGSNGFKINGIAASDNSGRSVASAGDINGDGVGDMMIGAYNASPNGSYSGQSYVIFGGSSVGSSGTIQLSGLNGSNGFKINGITVSDYSGFSVASAGDINADGVGDMIVGAYKASSNGSKSGQSYVIFGGSGVGSSGILQLSSLNGSNGFKISGIVAGDYSGISVASVGDINADGVGDVIVGAYKADPNGSKSGQSYVIFGGVGVGSSGTIQLSGLNGSNGFKINGIAVSDYSGVSVASAGDINADGVGDLIVGAYGADPNGSYSGQSYVVFGAISPPTLLQNQIPIKQSQKLAITPAMLNLTITKSSELVVPYYHITNSSYSHFEYNNNPSVPITEFSQQDINQGKVVFIQDGSSNVPNFELYIYKSFYRTGPIAGNIIFNTYPTLVNNQLTITEGATITITSNELQATDVTVPAGNLQFTMTGLSHGQFISSNNPTQSILQFSQSSITAGEIKFTHDGSNFAPAYRVAVSNGVLQTVADIAAIHFTAVNQSPQLASNNFILKSQGMTVITEVNLQATDQETPAGQLQFILSDITHGHFEQAKNPTIAITNFPQIDVTTAVIRFVVDGSNILPQFNIAVSDGNITINSVPAEIRFQADQSINTIAQNKNDNSTRNALIGTFAAAGLLTGLIIGYISSGALKNHHLKSVSKRKDEEESRYYQETIIPVAKEIFDKIKITSFLNYISGKQMEAYVAAVAAIVDKISGRGIDVQLDEMSDLFKKRLLGHIIKQMRFNLDLSKQGCSQFFKPQITPEQMIEKAQVIADGVYAALQSGADEEDMTLEDLAHHDKPASGGFEYRLMQ